MKQFQLGGFQGGVVIFFLLTQTGWSSGTETHSGARKMDDRPPAHWAELKDKSSKELKEIPDSYWKEKLDPSQYAVCVKAGTERPYSGKYDKFYEAGTYHCSACGAKLFESSTKFDSGSGWPSFFDKSGEVELKKDTSHGMVRTEVQCGKCGAHLGHVFEDGPAPTGKRYCINSVCLYHKPKKP